LQTNKARDAVANFDLIQSVDSPRLAAELNRRAENIGKVQDILVQVNTSGEAQKSGCTPDEAEALVDQTMGLPSLRLQGLMTIGPFTDDRQRIRESFVQLRGLFERYRGMDQSRDRMTYLSMGMTGDFDLALEQGANMLRIGTAIFGPRR
jgi:pyridoxal phosphate enzyme (YggS family)